MKNLKFLLGYSLLVLVLVGFHQRESILDFNAYNTNETVQASVNLFPVQDAPTKVFIARHAEKDTTDADNEDPLLTETGKARARALAETLKNKNIAAVYSTKYLRNMHTAQPLADMLGIPVKIYDGHDFDGLKSTIYQQHKGQSILVVGHSNTVLEIIESLGAKKPISEMDESMYNLFFEVDVRNKRKANVKTHEFGS